MLERVDGGGEVGFVNGPEADDEPRFSAPGAVVAGKAGGGEGDGS